MSVIKQSIEDVFVFLFERALSKSIGKQIKFVPQIEDKTVLELVDSTTVELYPSFERIEAGLFIIQNNVTERDIINATYIAFSYFSFFYDNKDFFILKRNIKSKEKKELLKKHFTREYKVYKMIAEGINIRFYISSDNYYKWSKELVKADFFPLIAEYINSEIKLPNLENYIIKDRYSILLANFILNNSFLKDLKNNIAESKINIFGISALSLRDTYREGNGDLILLNYKIEKNDRIFVLIPPDIVSDIPDFSHKFASSFWRSLIKSFNEKFNISIIGKVALYKNFSMAKLHSESEELLLRIMVDINIKEKDYFFNIYISSIFILYLYKAFGIPTNNNKFTNRAELFCSLSELDWEILFRYSGKDVPDVFSINKTESKIIIPDENFIKEEELTTLDDKTFSELQKEIFLTRGKRDIFFKGYVCFTDSLRERFDKVLSSIEKNNLESFIAVKSPSKQEADSSKKLFLEFVSFLVMQNKITLPDSLKTPFNKRVEVHNKAMAKISFEWLISNRVLEHVSNNYDDDILKRVIKDFKREEISAFLIGETDKFCKKILSFLSDRSREIILDDVKFNNSKISESSFNSGLVLENKERFLRELYGYNDNIKEDIKTMKSLWHKVHVQKQSSNLDAALKTNKDLISLSLKCGKEFILIYYRAGLLVLETGGDPQEALNFSLRAYLLIIKKKDPEILTEKSGFSSDPEFAEYSSTTIEDIYGLLGHSYFSLEDYRNAYFWLSKAIGGSPSTSIRKLYKTAAALL